MVQVRYDQGANLFLVRKLRNGGDELPIGDQVWQALLELEPKLATLKVGQKWEVSLRRSQQFFIQTFAEQFKTDCGEVRALSKLANNLERPRTVSKDFEAEVGHKRLFFTVDLFYKATRGKRALAAVVTMRNKRNIDEHTEEKGKRS